MTRKLLLVLTGALVLTTIAWASSPPSFDLLWGGQGGSNGKFNFPRDLVVSNTTLQVYVADRGNHRIQYFDGITGNFINKWGTLGSGNTNLRFPSGVALDASDNVYVSDNGNDRVVILSAPARIRLELRVSEAERADPAWLAATSERIAAEMAVVDSRGNQRHVVTELNGR